MIRYVKEVLVLCFALLRNRHSWFCIMVHPPPPPLPVMQVQVLLLRLRQRLRQQRRRHPWNPTIVPLRQPLARNK